MGRIIKFACLIALRPAEVIESTKLLICSQTAKYYYNPERQCLEHFTFPEIFLRRIKKAYISFVTPEMLEMAKGFSNSRTLTYNSIRLTCKRKGIKCDMRYCRKIFASHLRQSAGIQPEVIDMLQGRVSQSVLTRHYLVPQQGLKDQVLDPLKQLQLQL
jgi:intergrase/recombinase